jgi:hypothetical protein
METQSLNIKDALEEALGISGAIGAAIVDYENGLTLGTLGGSSLDMELAGSGTTEVVRSERNVLHDLNLKGEVEDILISLNDQFHLVQMCEHHNDVFIYVVIDRDQGNLGLARRSISKIDKRLVLE